MRVNAQTRKVAKESKRSSSDHEPHLVVASEPMTRNPRDEWRLLETGTYVAPSSSVIAAKLTLPHPRSFSFFLSTFLPSFYFLPFCLLASPFLPHSFPFLFFSLVHISKFALSAVSAAIEQDPTLSFRPQFVRLDVSGDKTMCSERNEPCSSLSDEESLLRVVKRVAAVEID